ncbi:hypothetical protein ABVK25_004017 [Lepraria finkii]|uniref:Uncharacterized protein n=1 Tax=Lepraria finkii TaxID=1340010 RepID=A0ABR4BEA2_9LECA
MMSRLQPPRYHRQHLTHIQTATCRLKKSSSNSASPADTDIDADSSSLADDDPSPVSPRRSAWEWTAGDIGIAFSPPMRRVHDEIWDEQMQTADEVDMESDREGGPQTRVGRRTEGEVVGL